MLFLQAAVTSIVMLSASLACARDNKIQRENLAEYIERMQQSAAVDAVSSAPGSLWNDNGRLAGLATDYKATHVGDLITIVVVQDVTAQNAGGVSTQRSLKASSGLSAVAGNPDLSEVQNLFSPSSSATLSGKSQAATTSSLRTRLAGRVAAVLPNGTLVVEAERQITMNNERQTVLVRGLVRPGDVNPDNTVLSNEIGNLELELKGKGVLSDGTRPPNVVIRWLLRLLNF